MPRKWAVGLVSLSLGLGSLTAAGQAAGDGPRRPQGRGRPDGAGRQARGGMTANPVARLKSTVDDLKLSGDTKTKVDAILTKAKEEAEKAQAGGDRRAAMTKAAEVAKTAEQEISMVLDEDERL